MKYYILYYINYICSSSVCQRLNVCSDIFHIVDLKKISMVPGEDCNAMIAIFAYKAIWNYALSLKLRFYPWNYAFILEIKLLSLKLRLYLRLYPWNYTFILEITLLSLKLRFYPWNYACILEITLLSLKLRNCFQLKLRLYPWNYALILEITLTAPSTPCLCSYFLSYLSMLKSWFHRCHWRKS